MGVRTSLVGAAIGFVVACGASRHDTLQHDAQGGDGGGGAQDGSSGLGSSSGGRTASGGAAGTVAAAGRDGGAASDGGGSGGAATGGSSAGTSPTRIMGRIRLETWLGPSDPHTDLDVNFWTNPQSSVSCTRMDVGSCSISCEATASKGGLDAGRVRVHSDEASFDVMLAPDDRSTYLSYGVRGVDFHGGEHVSISADGNTVPAFEDEIDYPQLLRVTSAAAPAGQLMAASDQDLTLTWDRGIAGVDFVATGAFITADRVAMSLECSVSSEVGTLTIPAALLSKFPPQGSIELLTVASHVVSGSNFDVAITAIGEVLSTDDTYPVYIQLP